MSKFRMVAEKMWEAYSVKAGGKTFDGKPLPKWNELGSDRQECWVAAARAAAVALSDD